MEKFKFLKIKNINKLPKTAGVYIFKQTAKIIYIGKAVNLRDRSRQHKDLINLADKIGYFETGSEIAALIFEAKLIKKYQPKYNVDWKDDKNYLYAAITREDFPKIFVTHRPKDDRRPTLIIGPFVDSTALKETLKILRKVFPYRTCNPPSGGLPKHACLWYHLQRCPAPCLIDPQIPGFKEKTKKECQRNAQNIITTLRDGKSAILKKLKKEMLAFSKKQQFEQASRIKDQINSLEKTFAHSVVFSQSNILKETRLPSAFYRAEGYDIANIQGKEATGAMIVFIDGKPAKSEYRQFKIKGKQEPNDIAMLKEVLERRFKHNEWPSPDLILIDGGKAQLNVALSITRGKARKKSGFRVMALAKKNNELYIEGEEKPVLLKNTPRETFNLILQMRDEAHRFARRYHHKLRKRTLLGS
jgi:excinuclease ABC subunit C